MHAQHVANYSLYRYQHIMVMMVVIKYLLDLFVESSFLVRLLTVVCGFVLLFFYHNLYNRCESPAVKQIENVDLNHQVQNSRSLKK